MKPALYLDIDGVLLANEENLSIGAAEFTKSCKFVLLGFIIYNHRIEGYAEKHSKLVGVLVE